MAELPKWLTRRDDGVMVIDPDIAYPAVLTALGVKDGDLDQYWIEVAYQCAKMRVQDLVEGTEYDPRPNRALTIHVQAHGGRKDRWALTQYPPGRGAELATKGRAARQHYALLRARF